MFDLQRYNTELEKLVNIDSGSLLPDGINEIADFFDMEFRSLGWDVARSHVSALTGDFLEVRNHIADRYDLMISGHIDTVFPAGEARKRPFRIEDGVAYGPGVYDMKCGALCMLWIARMLPREILDNINICMCFTPDEEINSRFSHEYSKRVASKSNLAFIMEGTDSEDVYTTIRCGQLGYEIFFHGIAAHSGYIFERPNASAIVEMARWITALNALSNREKHTMVNIGIVSGGTAANQVPGEARMTVSIRVIEASESVRIKEAIDALSQNISVDGVTVECRQTVDTPPMFPSNAALDYVERARSVLKESGYSFKLAGIRSGCSDGNFISAAGTPCLDTMGPLGGKSHTENEYLYLAEAEKCIIKTISLIEGIVKSKP